MNSEQPNLIYRLAFQAHISEQEWEGSGDLLTEACDALESRDQRISRLVLVARYAAAIELRYPDGARGVNAMRRYLDALQPGDL